MELARERLEMRTELYLGTLKDEDRFEEIHIDGRIILMLILKKYSLRQWPVTCCYE
jgi:hypothetical protein